MTNYTGEEKWPVIEEARRRLLEIPGHAEYYEKKIGEAVAERHGEFGDQTYARKIGLIFETLGHMPSEETVEVLLRHIDSRDGEPPVPRTDEEMLEWSRLYGPVGTLRGHTFLAQEAGGTLGALGIENRPPLRQPGQPGAWLESWREWCERVRAGKLSYKFQGDPLIYPTGTTAPPYAGEKRGSPGSRDRAENPGGGNGAVGRNSRAGPDSREDGNGRRLWLWALGIAFLTLAGWWWVRRKKT